MECDKDKDFDKDDLPDIFQIQFMPSNLQNVYVDILKNIPTCDVQSAFADYVGENIEPLGWKAIWKPSSSDYPPDCSFIVNVVDVYYQTLEASVIAIDLVFPKKSDLTDKEDEMVKSVLTKTADFTVPLIDLYVVSNLESDSFYETAYIIELLRFFYKNIWRAWDELDENSTDEDFVTTRLMPRLALICDIKNNILTDWLVNRFNYIISESFNIKQKMDQLNKKVKDNSIKEDLIDEDNLPNQEPMNDFMIEIDATEFVKLKMKLEDFEREMKIIEDPHLRSLYHTLMPAEVDETTVDQTRTLHLVSHEFSFNTLNSIMAKVERNFTNNERANWPIKLHNSLQKAIKVSNSGDCIYITGGIYCYPLSWIEKNIEIIGIDDNVELWSHSECGDVLLFFNTNDTVTLSNLKIKANHSLNHLIVVKCGHLILDFCTLDCNHQTKKPIFTVAEASVQRNHCHITNLLE